MGDKPEVAVPICVILIVAAGLGRAVWSYQRQYQRQYRRQVELHRDLAEGNIPQAEADPAGAARAESVSTQVSPVAESRLKKVLDQADRRERTRPKQAGAPSAAT